MVGLRRQSIVFSAVDLYGFILCACLLPFSQLILIHDLDNDYDRGNLNSRSHFFHLRLSAFNVRPRTSFRGYVHLTIHTSVG